MEKFLMCFIKGLAQVIEFNGESHEKRARREGRALNQPSMATAKVGNFIVGKKRVRGSLFAGHG
jgi:hypothetical protein